MSAIEGYRIHGNTSTGQPFHECEVGDEFFVNPEDYAKTNCARAHFQKRKWRESREVVRFRSKRVLNDRGDIEKYRFVRVE